MGEWVPPYINKHIDSIKKELSIAERKVFKAEKELEYAKEYYELCKKQLENAENDK